MRTIALSGCLIAACVAFTAKPAHSDAGDPTPATSKSGEYFDKQGNPTYKIANDGTVDWYTFVGYQQYGANCLQCHGPDGLGSTYAPSLVDAMKSLSKSEVFQTITEGKKNVSAAQNQVMPSLGGNKNVMCNIDAIYIYLRARSGAALDRGRPAKSEPKPADYDKRLDACLGGG
jgi:methanol metabolism-related c-type cytochrome